MYSLSKTTSGSKKERKVMEESEKLSVFYHDLFDYPLTFSDLIKWNIGMECITSIKNNTSVTCNNGYYFLEKHDGLIYKRILRKRVSEKKILIAKKASRILSLIPSIKMIAVTGSLAMENAEDKSDIDLMIITKSGALWSTRLFVYFVIYLFGIQKRNPGDKIQEDKLCLNMWMDENDLIWRSPRNIYTAHEIAQIMPLANKDRTYEKFLFRNKWVLNFWPNSVKIENLRYLTRDTVKIKKSRIGENLLEKIVFKLQYIHMKAKITREVITKTRAIFHPNDIGKTVLTRLRPLV
jgi:predicted nucleotidyltransferase